jgi:predicted nucleotidyltransferase
MPRAIALLIEDIAEVCRRYQVKELSIFGSAARGDMRSDSDIDLLVEFEPRAPIGLLKFASLTAELEQLLHRKVDLVTKSGLKPWLRTDVLKEARVVYQASLVLLTC